MRFCTVANAATLPHARVLSRGLAEHHSDRLTVLVIGPQHLAMENEAFEVVRPEDLNVHGWENLLADHRWVDLAEFLKPHLMSHLIADGASTAVYLDVTVDIHDSLEPLVGRLGDHGAVVAPRLLGELPMDGHRPNREDLRRAGRIGAPLIAFGQTGAVEVLSWWAERLLHAARVLPAPAADESYPARELSRWFDLVPTLFRHVSVLADVGAAVSQWNLHERRLEQEDGTVTVDGRPLRFMQFDDFDPARPFLLSRTADRVRVSESQTLAALCESYVRRLERAGWRDNGRRAEVGRQLPNGMTFDDRMSRLLAEAAASGEELGDVFSERGAEAFMNWLNEPAPHGRMAGINRYLYRVYRERHDVPIAYPNLDGPDGHEFAAWAWVFGVREMSIPERFLPPRPHNVKGPASSDESARERALPSGQKPDLSMNVTGLLTGTLGLGEAARSYVSALKAADIPVSTSAVDVRKFMQVSESAQEGYAQVEYADIPGAERAGFNLVCINADELLRFAETVGNHFFEERPCIGVWAWETDHIPQRWAAAYELVDEIWVYSNYVAENLRRVAPVPVQRIPPPVSPPDPGEVELNLGVPDGFQFLFMFDFFSTIQRKNPVGLIEAFRQAFEPGEGPQLVIKTINGVHRHQALEEVLWAARGRPDVHVLDRSLSARERDALVAGCDCYVSLHRSEGFGLTLAECMVLGKPVIGTAFSATTDFMTEQNSYPISYEMTRVGADCEVYPAEGTWADPDVDEAARLMRRVLEQPEEARAKGEHARRDVEERYAPGVVGEMIRSRLEELRGLWR